MPAIDCHPLVNRGDAYGILCDKLNALRGAGYSPLLPRVGQPTRSEALQINGEPVVVDLDVFWADRKQDRLRVRGTALGPSTWITQRLEESFIIAPSTSTAG